MPIKRKVQGIRGPVPTGVILGRIDDGDGDVQLLSITDLAGFGVVTRGPGGGGSSPPAPAGGAGVIPLVTGSEPPVLVSDGAGNLVVVDFP